MGRQFRFYILPSDANALVEQLKQQFKAKLLLDYSPAFESLEIDYPFRMNDSGDLKPVSARHRYYLAPPFGHIKREYYPKPDWWVVNSDSDGIEFEGCEFEGNTLLIGRFWYQTNVLVNLQYVSKGAEFLKWAEAVYRYTKKSLRYEPKIYAFVGRDAMSFRERGGQFASMIRPDGRIIPA